MKPADAGHGAVREAKRGPSAVGIGIGCFCVKVVEGSLIARHTAHYALRVEYGRYSIYRM